MFEEAPGVLGADRRYRCTYCFHQRFLGSGRGLAKEILYLRERLLDRVVVRRVGRQVDELASLLLDELSYPLGSMCPQVIHDHYLPFLQHRREHLLYVGLEETGRGRSLYGQRRSHPS